MRPKWLHRWSVERKIYFKKRILEYWKGVTCQWRLNSERKDIPGWNETPHISVYAIRTLRNVIVDERIPWPNKLSAEPACCYRGATEESESAQMYYDVGRQWLTIIPNTILLRMRHDKRSSVFIINSINFFLLLNSSETSETQNSMWRTLIRKL